MGLGGLPGTYFPLHKFSMDPKYIARTFAEFKTIVTNPGPFSVRFSNEYLEWYWAAYQNKVKNHERRQKKQQEMQDEIKQTPTGLAVVKRHLYEMPITSERRRIFQERKDKAQELIDEYSVHHATMDLWERKAQYPSIDMFTNCTTFHYHSLLEKFLEHESDVRMFWIRIALYSSLIIERYAQKYFKEAPELEEVISQVAWERTKNFSNMPSEKLHLVLVRLLRKYNIQNAVECALVLRCIENDALNTLTTADASVKIGPEEATVSTLLGLCPVEESTLFHEENLPIIKLYLYAEMNAWTPTNVFKQHPMAKEVATLPQSDLSKIPSPESMKFFFATSVPQIRKMESRLREIQVLHRNITTQDDRYINARSLYNPKTFRAEIRDAVTIQMERALKRFEIATNNLKPRSPEEEADELAEKGGVQIKPSVYYFVRRLKSEPSVSLALTLDNSGEVRRCLFDAAKEMYYERLHYFDDKLRYLHNQQAKIALTLLDQIIQKTIDENSEIFEKRSAKGFTSFLQISSNHVPLADRQLDEYGALTRHSRQNYERRYLSPFEAEKNEGPQEKAEES